MRFSSRPTVVLEFRALVLPLAGLWFNCACRARFEGGRGCGGKGGGGGGRCLGPLTASVHVGFFAKRQPPNQRRFSTDFDQDYGLFV